MNKFITNLYGQSERSTAMIAQHMIADVAKEQGYSEIAIKSFRVTDDSEAELAKRIEGMLSAVRPEDMVLVQMPSWNGIAFDKVFIHMLRERVKKMAIFIHDFVPLMFENNRYLTEHYLKAYNESDLVIVPSTKMGKLLIEEGLETPYMVQDIWDHMTDGQGLGKPKFEKRLNFAGNTTRFPFINKWKGSVPVSVYSDLHGEVESDNVEMKGWMHDYELLHSLNKGGFGLVWSENIENQSEREYSTMNVSFKFSAYLAAGIPIIVNKELAKQKFVEQHGIGFVAESLDEVNQIVENMNEDEYNILLQNVDNVSQLVREGYFARKLLVEVQEELFLRH